MGSAWLVTSWEEVAIALLTALGAYASIVLYTRLVGLRSFSKMSSFDFAITVAIGSMFASMIVSRDISLLFGVVGLGSLYGIQLLVTLLRTRSEAFESLVDNGPVLLLRHGVMREEAMRRVGVTRSDLIAKLREANVIRLEDALAVVFQATGDISVLHAQNGDPSDVEPVLLEGVDGA